MTVDEDMKLDEDDTVDKGRKVATDKTVAKDMKLAEDMNVHEYKTLDEDVTVDEDRIKLAKREDHIALLRPTHPFMLWKKPPGMCTTWTFRTCVVYTSVCL